MMALTSCSPWYDRHGVPPILSAAAVTTSTVNREALMELFVRRSRVNAPLPTASRDWYFVMDAGFNYVDEICDSYIHEMFLLDRGRDKIKSGVILLDKATNAILEATRASTKSMVVVAQAFGIASGATDVFANSYLFKLEPANIQQLVREMRNAHRAEAFARAQQFSYPTAVEHGIQAYLNLCLPATIEARVNEILNRTKVIADSTAPIGPFVQVLPVSERAPNRKEIAESQEMMSPTTGVRDGRMFGPSSDGSVTVITGPRGSGNSSPGQSNSNTRVVENLQNQVRQKDETIQTLKEQNQRAQQLALRGALTATERDLDSGVLSKIKKALCVRGTDLELNAFDPQTRERVREFIGGYNWNSVNRNGAPSFDRNLVPTLERAAQLYPACGDPLKNAYEVGLFTQSPDQVDVTLNQAAVNLQITPRPANRREFIVALRRKFDPQNQSPSDELDDRLWKFIKDNGKPPGPPIPQKKNP